MHLIKRYGLWTLAFFVVKGTFVTFVGWRLTKADWFQPHHLILLSLGVALLAAIGIAIRKSRSKPK